MKTLRKMPARVDLGSSMKSTLSHCVHISERFERGDYKPRKGVRYIMGFQLPTWQRGLVWTRAQKIAFIESAWRGIPLGTFSYNLCYDRPDLDYLLIDGQQRMATLEEYLADKFKVLGWKWSQVTESEQRGWEMTTSFPCYVTKTEDEEYLRNYYNLMNFGGTAHVANERV